MVGMNLVSKCPYCGKVITQHIGRGQYFIYKEDGYEPRIVRIAWHNKCAMYITPDYSLDLIFNPSLTIPLGKKTLPILRCKIDDMACTHSSEEIVQELKADLLSYVLVHSTEENKERNIQSLKDNEPYIRETVEKICNYYNKADFWSLPLTEDVKTRLEFHSVVMY